MSRPELSRLAPDASSSLLEILDPARGPVEPPIRSEIFGPERFAQHGRSLGETHAARYARTGSAAFFPRLRENVRVLREAHRTIGLQATTGYDLSPAAEWLLDNFHLIESQLAEIRLGFPRRYFRALPVLQHEPLVGLPRVYGVAWAFVAHTDSAFNEDLLLNFLRAYQTTRELTLGELWALPTTLRVVLIENLRRLAERIGTNKAAREIANLCCDRIESYTPAQLDAVLALLNRRGIGEVFLAQMAQRLHDLRAPEQMPYVEWLHRAAPDLAGIQTRQPALQAADNLSVSNAITSLRSISDADWPEIVSSTSVLIQAMLRSPAFAAERDDTRDQTLHEIEALARRSGRSERAVATTLLELMGRPTEAPSDDADAATSASHWLAGSGRPELLGELGLHERAAAWRRGLLKRSALPAYLGAVTVLTAVLIGWLLARHGAPLPEHATPLGLMLLTAVLMFFPASEAVVAVVNRLISESARPSRLPRLALNAGIPPEHRVMVVIPAMLTDADAAHELAHRLQLHYLANPEDQAQFALLTDWRDASAAQTPTDAALLDAAIAEVEQLNARYPSPPGDARRFILLHRERSYCESEQSWIGWERKRGKLEQLLAALATATPGPFLDLGECSRIGAGTRYLVTLDSDTRLPPGRLRDLVGVAAHPHNQPRLDASGRRVDRGYGILQPRVVTPLPLPQHITLYHWLFAGQWGIDPYSVATSEVYQDVFGEGTFTGKGLIHVQAAHAVLGGRLPEDQVLSHDLLEGSLARCAAVTDITVVEEAPFHADVAAARVHRWTRGDWQLLPLLFGAHRYGIRAINGWKMIDNLRRSLVAPMSLGLVLLALATGVVAPWVALALVSAAFAAGPMMGALAAFVSSRSDIAKPLFYRQASADLARGLLSGAWLLAQLVQLALMSGDAIVRALYRTFVSRRHLLEWTTAAAAQASAQTRLGALVRKHWGVPVVALALAAALALARTPFVLTSVLLCLVWAASPIWTWWVSRPRPPRREAALSAADHGYLYGTARETWRLFERIVGPADNHLPPDNLQCLPNVMLAHRTSPTNIGLYLLSAACAHRFGWIGSTDLIGRLEATLATLERLRRHRGHFLNWYDTETTEALQPMYVSTVDSGNLSGLLLAVAQACNEFARVPPTGAPRQALKASAAMVAALRARTPELPLGTALDRLLSFPDPLASAQANAGTLDRLLARAGEEVAGWPASDAADRMPSARDRLAWAIGDHLSTLGSALRDVQPVAADAAADARRLHAIATTCQRLAWEADYGFLYHRKRRLLHIGFRLADQQLDAGFYDLLASESRVTSLVAIAKGDVPAAHWAALGRPFYAAGSVPGLRSWSGSMFEYLMPTLLLDEPDGSVLYDAAHAALHEQIEYAHRHEVPWGISESAYAASDHTLAYQYSPQGVPRLALRRTPTDELVIAPYATALAAQIAPHRAVANLRALEARAGRGRYGFIEALDYTPARQSGDEGVARVVTFMAHHQGMSLVALANVLLDGLPRRWGMGDPRIEAVASLLHERAPREVPVLGTPPAGPTPAGLAKRAPGMQREVLPGMSAIEPTHLLSNGRYAVSLRANGAGWSRWGETGITRSRDDILRDAFGSFIHLRWDRQPRAVSITQHPAPDPAAHYQSTFHADRVSFSASWPELDASATVWVSPEDDIEFREVVLRNLGDRVLDIELMSAFEVTLADVRADEAHPAFSNLFVSAEWRARHQALVFERRPRLPTERGLHAAHFLADPDPQLHSIRVQVDRNRWLGRNGDASDPRAEFDLPPAPTTLAPGHGASAGVALDTGLDPVCALSIRLQILPRSRAHLTLCTAVSDNAETLAAVIDKYREPSHVDRASMMTSTLTAIRLRELRINSDNFAAIQDVTTALVSTLTRPQALASESSDVCDRRLLWRFGISGDRPIVLVSAGVAQGLGLLRSVAQALRLWSWGGVACDLVVVNSEPASYLMALSRDIAALRESHVAALAAQPGAAPVGFHLLQATDVRADELSTLRALARLRLNADGRPLSHHVAEWVTLHDQALEERQGVSRAALPPALRAQVGQGAPGGRFAATSGEYRFDVSALRRPARPWINVLANAGFGAQLSEAGGGYTWAMNSRLNQLTGWSNDPVTDPASEWLLLQDLKTMQVWSVTPSAFGDVDAEYHVAHGQGYSSVNHRHGPLDVTATWCVDPDSAVKQIRLRLINRGHKALQLRAIAIAEWVMGANRGDRGSTHTSMLEQRIAVAPMDGGGRADLTLTPRADANGKSGAERVTALFCTQRDRSAGFGDGTAFLALVRDTDDAHDWTTDRRESFDARGRLVVPDNYAHASGPGLDPCATLSTRITMRAGDTIERVFLLGFGASPDAARQLAVNAAAVPALQRLEDVATRWDDLLDATRVSTPDPLFDAMVNRWLLYQTVVCRLWAKAGFYQAGGAYGYRDQLQDSMALGWAAPDMFRRQIVVAASRQFPEGDVQHWWHAPTGAGVRTHFSDDLLWLPYACTRYLNVTGDRGVLDESVPFIEGAAIPEGAEDAYYVPSVSAQHATVFEHCARAIDRSLGSGSHGLPLMGTGDWNDGMNRVGHEGRGESVWLAWFLCDLIEGFSPIARERGELERVERWSQAVLGWKGALETHAWDGEWYRRAFFDDGSPLGSSTNSECRIDLIAQAWSVLSGAAPVEHRRSAMAALDRELVDHDAGLVKLLEPPLQRARPSAGYIQAYPPGVRENGGQYSHAGVWALMAQAAQGDGDAAYRYFTYLSPAHRARHPTHGAAYAIEPYVMAGDVYTAAPYVGRGGWSWYTGSAAWMHRAALETMFGLRQLGTSISFAPQLPAAWDRAELTLRRDGRSVRVIFSRSPERVLAGEPGAAPPALLGAGAAIEWGDVGDGARFVVAL